jgi:hypothetical protein
VEIGAGTEVHLKIVGISEVECWLVVSEDYLEEEEVWLVSEELIIMKVGGIRIVLLQEKMEDGRRLDTREVVEEEVSEVKEGLEEREGGLEVREEGEGEVS